jgi:hypothetical protein
MADKKFTIMNADGDILDHQQVLGLREQAAKSLADALVGLLNLGVEPVDVVDMADSMVTSIVENAVTIDRGLPN